MIAKDEYPHGTLAGFLGGCRQCDCCASAFADHLSDAGKKLFIFAMNYRQVRLWTDQRRLPERLWKYVLDPTRDLRAHREDYYLVLTGASLLGGTRALITSSAMTKVME